MKRFLKIFVVLLSLSFLVGAVFYLPRHIIIKSIICSSQYGQCTDSFNEELKEFTNKSLLESKSALRTYLSSKEYIEKYSLHFQLPDKYKLDLIERKASYAIGDESLGFLLVDNKGVVLAKSQTTDLPHLNLSEPIVNKGGRVSEETLFALDILAYLFDIYGLKTGLLRPEQVEFFLPQGPKVIFPLEGDGEVLIGSLRLIMGGLNSYIESHKIEKAQNQITIDLRFKNPVIQ